MTTATSKKQCFICQKEKITYKCEGCSKEFCLNDLPEHRRTLNTQFDEIEDVRNVLLQSVIQQKEDTKKHSSIQQIDKWEKDSINKIKQTADECRQVVIKFKNKFIIELENKLVNITEQIRQTRQDNEFNEIDLNQLKEKLTKLQEELNKPLNITIKQQPTSFINNIFVSTPFLPLRSSLTDISVNATWNKDGQTVTGKNPALSYPYGLYMDDDDEAVYIADHFNHRIVAWKNGEPNGQVVAGGHGKGNGAHQLNSPTDVIVDKERDSLIICDSDNRRIVRWSRQNGASGETIIPNISCWGITMDENGSLYVTDVSKHAVRRYRMGESQGTIVAGGNGKGNRLDQLNYPTYIFIDKEHSVFVSDCYNHRVMKWTEGAKEGIVVAGGQGQGNSLTQLNNPRGILVDQFGTVYVANAGNNQIVRWPKGAHQGDIIVGGNGKGAQANQLDWPIGMSFDQHSHLYVVDYNNNRVQQFTIDIPSN